MQTEVLRSILRPVNRDDVLIRRVARGMRAIQWRLGLVLLLSAFDSFPAAAAVVWKGPLVTFTEAAGADPTLAANQDRLTLNVWLTRASSAGLFNAKTESGYSRFTSPAGTEWAYGSLDNYAALTFGTWAAMSGNNPPSMVGKSAVEHLVADDIYLAVTFNSWGGLGGGFSYTRSTPSVPEPSAGALMLVGVGFLLWPRWRGEVAKTARPAS